MRYLIPKPSQLYSVCWWSFWAWVFTSTWHWPVGVFATLYVIYTLFAAAEAVHGEDA